MMTYTIMCFCFYAHSWAPNLTPTPLCLLSFASPRIFLGLLCRTIVKTVKHAGISRVKIISKDAFTNIPYVVCRFCLPKNFKLALF